MLPKISSSQLGAMAMLGVVSVTVGGVRRSCMSRCTISATVPLSFNRSANRRYLVILGSKKAYASVWRFMYTSVLSLNAPTDRGGPNVFSTSVLELPTVILAISDWGGRLPRTVFLGDRVMHPDSAVAVRVMAIALVMEFFIIELYGVVVYDEANIPCFGRKTKLFMFHQINQKKPCGYIV